jgi:hypothetical protein
MSAPEIAQKHDGTIVPERWNGNFYQTTLRATNICMLERSRNARNDFDLTTRNKTPISQKNMGRAPQDRTHECESLRTVPFQLLPYRGRVQGRGMFGRVRAGRSPWPSTTPTR